MSEVYVMLMFFGLLLLICLQALCVCVLLFRSYLVSLVIYLIKHLLWVCFWLQGKERICAYMEDLSQWNLLFWVWLETIYPHEDVLISFLMWQYVCYFGFCFWLEGKETIRAYIEDPSQWNMLFWVGLETIYPHEGVLIS